MQNRYVTPQEAQQFTLLARSFFRTESSGNFHAIGNWVTYPNGHRDRAYGITQTMGDNIPSWTQRHYGRSLTPQEYLSNYEAQIAVSNGMMSEYFQTALGHANGDRDLAIRIIGAMWFGGEGAWHQYDNPNYCDVNGMCMDRYTTNILTDYRQFESNFPQAQGEVNWIEATAASRDPGPSEPTPEPVPVPDSEAPEAPDPPGTDDDRYPTHDGLPPPPDKPKGRDPRPGDSTPPRPDPPSVPAPPEQRRRLRDPRTKTPKGAQTGQFYWRKGRLFPR